MYLNREANAATLCEATDLYDYDNKDRSSVQIRKPTKSLWRRSNSTTGSRLRGDVIDVAHCTQSDRP